MAVSLQLSLQLRFGGFFCLSDDGKEQTVSMLSSSRSLSVQEKMTVILHGIREISKSRTENDACLQALIALEGLHYPKALISFLKTIEGERFIVGESRFAVGDKWE